MVHLTHLLLSLLSFSTLSIAQAEAAPVAENQNQKRATWLTWDYNNLKVNGVNLGGWFVLEPFITPSLFSQFSNFGVDIPVDEYHLTQQYTTLYGKDATQQLLEAHWSSWITEADFVFLNQTGINFVRIPIGYWAFTPLYGDPYVQGQEAYLVKALQWARTHGLKVWIDLHGAPGSQNGFDNSGLRDNLNWQTNDYVQRSLDIISYITTTYGGPEYQDIVEGIELVNEPLGPSLDMDKIKNYYTDGFTAVRDGGSDTGVIIHDAFQALHYWDDFMSLPDYWNVVLDHHHYEVFDVGQLQMDINAHISSVCNVGWSTQSESLWRVFGEWSAALTDCTYWLNGVGRGARYDATFENSNWIGSCQGIDDFSTWTDDKKAATRRYIEAQLDAYNQGNGWIFWNYKTEQSIEWSYVDLINNGLFPQPFTDRQYPNQCGF